MTTEKMYSIAIRKRKDEKDFFWNYEDFIFQEIKIDCQKRYWLADPFLFEKDGIVYLFYEAFDLIQRRGKIGYSIIEENANSIPIHIILEESYHLSFPNVFECEGNIYMMPETCGNNTIKLYKSSNFPNEWKEHKTVLSDIFACDTIIAQDGSGNKYMITSEMYRGLFAPNGNYTSCWVKNVCYKLNYELQVEGEGTIIAEGDCGIRNAGNTFVCNGKLYRVGQNSPNRQYGKGLVLFEVNSLEPYKEQLLWIKDCNDFESHIRKLNKSDIIGVHTYNFSKHYEVIDFSQIREWRFATKLLKRKVELFNKYIFWGGRVYNRLIRIFH